MRVFIVATKAVHRKVLFDRVEAMGHDVVGMARALFEVERRMERLDPPDAFLTDHMLPDGFGSAIAEIVPSTPILAILPRRMELTEDERLLYAGVIQRPFDPMTLMASLEAMSLWTETGSDHNFGDS
ncbi:MAG: hypothetical protein AAGH15_00925 [Myxococcota bacterium]